MEDASSWKSVFDQLRSEPHKRLTDSTPLHEKLRELLIENSQTFDQLRSSERKSDARMHLQKMRSSSQPQEEKSSSISFRPSSSRASSGREQIPPPVSTRPFSINVFEASDPKCFVEVEDTPEPVAVAPPKKRSAKQRQPSPSPDDKKTVKTKTGVGAAMRKRTRTVRSRRDFPEIESLEPELKGVVIAVEEKQSGRYARRRHYAPLLDFLFENVTRDPAGDLRLQVADLKARPKSKTRRRKQQSTVPPTQLDGITVECVEEDEREVIYKLRLVSGQQKAPAVAQLPVRLRAEGRMKKCLAVSIGPSAHSLTRSLLSGGEAAEVRQGCIYALENVRGRTFSVTLTVFKPEV